MMLFEWLVIYACLGAAVGFLAGLLGVGGGGILVPLLTGLLIHQGNAPQTALRTALGTSLACMIFSAGASLRAHHHQGTVNWPFVWSMAPGIIVGSFVTTQYSLQVPHIYIAIFFTLFMSLVAIQLFVNWQPKPSKSLSSWKDKTTAGILIGCISALAAVGGGFLTITYLQYKQLVIKQVIGTTAAIGLPIALAGTLGYLVTGLHKANQGNFSLGYISLPAFISITVTSILLAPIGAKLSKRLPDKLLKKILAIICVLLSIRMLMTLI